MTWSILFYTTVGGVETRLECRAAFLSDRSLVPGGTNPHCESVSRNPPAETFANGFPLVLQEISERVFEIRSPRITFTDGSTAGWTFTDFALRTEVTNPTQPFVTPRADFRPTL
ncbi:MAG: hypothetical protein U0325_14025 [Polyangiales bacterium]